MRDCAGHLLLLDQIIPPLSWDNSAGEAICKIPVNLPRMAVFDIRAEYRFTADEYLMRLDPDYIPFAGGKSDGTPDKEQCAKATNTAFDTFTWVDWLTPVKKVENGRGWVIDETLPCVHGKEDSGIKRPGIPIVAPPIHYLIDPFTTFGEMYTLSQRPYDPLNKYQHRYNDLKDALDKAEEDFNHMKEHPDEMGGFHLNGECGISISEPECEEKNFDEDSEEWQEMFGDDSDRDKPGTEAYQRQQNLNDKFDTSWDAAQDKNTHMAAWDSVTGSSKSKDKQRAYEKYAEANKELAEAKTSTAKERAQRKKDEARETILGRSKERKEHFMEDNFPEGWEPEVKKDANGKPILGKDGKPLHDWKYTECVIYVSANILPVMMFGSSLFSLVPYCYRYPPPTLPDNYTLEDLKAELEYEEKNCCKMILSPSGLCENGFVFWTHFQEDDTFRFTCGLAPTCCDPESDNYEQCKDAQFYFDGSGWRMASMCAVAEPCSSSESAELYE